MTDPFLRAYRDWIERVDQMCRRRRLPGVIGGVYQCGVGRDDNTPPAWVVDQLCEASGLERPEPVNYTFKEVRRA